MRPIVPSTTDAFVREIERLPARRAGTRGRLLFAMDATEAASPHGPCLHHPGRDVDGRPAGQPTRLAFIAGSMNSSAAGRPTAANWRA
jgi:hypothetical protein